VAPQDTGDIGDNPPAQPPELGETHVPKSDNFFIRNWTPPVKNDSTGPGWYGGEAIRPGALVSKWFWAIIVASPQPYRHSGAAKRAIRAVAIGGRRGENTLPVRGNHQADACNQ
jgi:hypothetical protein